MKTTVQIPGMHCASCVSLVKDVSSDFSEIKTVEVNLDSKEVVIEHDGELNLGKWKSEIEALGDAYKVTTAL